MAAVHICMGSSCYSRGNKRVIEQIERHLKRQKRDDVSLVGKLCCGRCNAGPHLEWEGETLEQATPEAVETWLNRHF